MDFEHNGGQMDLALEPLLDQSTEVTVRNGWWVTPSVHLSHQLGHNKDDATRAATSLPEKHATGQSRRDL